MASYCCYVSIVFNYTETRARVESKHEIDYRARSSHPEPRQSDGASGNKINSLFPPDKIIVDSSDLTTCKALF